MSSGPTPNFSLTILPISLCLSPGKLSELSLIQTPHLCFQDSLPTSACRDILNAHLQASCRSFHLSKHLTCVFRTYSQPQPVEILTMHFKRCRFGQSVDRPPASNDLTANMYKTETKTHCLNQEYSNSSMPLTLQQQHTNLVITSEP